VELTGATPAGLPTLAGRALTLIHTGQAPTRSALTGLLGVTRATTGALAGELRDLGLIVVEAGLGGREQVSGQQGRPSHRLLPDPSGPVALAAQVHPDGFEVALVGLAGTVIARLGQDAPVPADPRQALDPVTAAAAGLLRESGRRCVGAVVAVPAAVSQPAGTAVRALYTGWPADAPVRDIFAGQLAARGVTGPDGAPVGCDAVNDVNAIALAEHRHGAGRGATHLLVVAAGHRGVGGALVQHGALYTGSTGLAMEAGHVSVDRDGRPCTCGNRGCLNVETDAGRFLELAGQVPAAGEPLLRQAVAVLRGGYPADDQVRAAADAIAARLGLGLAGLVNVVNPDRVLLGGLHGHLLALAPARLREAVAAGSPWGSGAAIPAAPCALEHAGLIGAAEIAWQPVLSNPALLRRRPRPSDRPDAGAGAWLQIWHYCGQCNCSESQCALK
jgi:predicted NBD/HSP70 family sugar kinase